MPFLRNLIAAAALAAAPVVHAMPFESIVVFGDSLSDAGASASAAVSLYKLMGNACAVPCPPYADGRFSNGPVAVERLAASRGLADPAHFQDFAVAGATTGVGNYLDRGSPASPGDFLLPGMGAIAQQYLALRGGSADPAALYVIWGGPNDVFSVLDGYSVDPDFVATAVGNVAGLVQALAGAGATHILVPNMPDLGLTPFGRSLGAAGSALLSAISSGFNADLAGAVSTLDGMLAADILLADVGGLLQDAIADPARFGFTNVTDACLGPNGVCATPDTYLFWDGVHPTARGHAVLGDFFAARVPEPATALLVVLGAIGLRRSRRA